MESLELTSKQEFYLKDAAYKGQHESQSKQLHLLVNKMNFFLKCSVPKMEHVPRVELTFIY
jgi:hypothetical protein